MAEDGSPCGVLGSMGELDLLAARTWYTQARRAAARAGPGSRRVRASFERAPQDRGPP